jgi:hypothetical protein
MGYKYSQWVWKRGYGSSTPRIKLPWSVWLSSLEMVTYYSISVYQRNNFPVRNCKPKETLLLRYQYVNLLSSFSLFNVLSVDQVPSFLIPREESFL